MVKNKQIKRRFSGLLMAAVITFASLPDTVLYAESPVAQTEEDKVHVYTLKNQGEVSEYGYQDTIWVDEDGNRVVQENERLSHDTGLSKSSGISFPVSYSMADYGVLPAVRNQGKWGTCWAHSSICSVETNMVKKGLCNASDVDYSERHLSYFAHKRNESMEDGKDSYDSEYGWYGGGNYRMAMFSLAAWSGAAAESDFPYSSYGDMADLGEESRYSSVCHLTNAYELKTSQEVKRAIMDNGSVICSYYSDDSSIDNQHYAVYHTENPGTNHLVSIVGWDDEYSTANFSGSANGSIPSSDGAWLCRNSWGDWWGNQGYFWISYEDASLGYFCSFEAERNDNYDNIYQYDGAGYNCYVGYEKTANIFTAKSLEELKAVSFYTYGSYDYMIDIYIEGEQAMSVPSDGMLVCTKKGTVSQSGYHTVNLDNSVILDAGMKYAVSVEFIAKDGGDVYSYMEQGDNYSSERGQSFVLTGTGQWKDTKDLTSFSNAIKNVCIKAFTDDLGSVDISILKPSIDSGEQLKAEDYTVSSWEVFITELEKAKSVYGAATPSPSEIIKAKSGLESAMTNLIPCKVYIENEADYGKFAKSVSEGSDYAGQTVYLLRDLDMSGITYDRAGTKASPFMGTFDGGGYSIKNLNYSYQYSYGGLFGYIGETGVVKNLTVENADMTYGASYCGGIAGVNDGVISDCSIYGNLVFENTSGAAGGIAGQNNGTIKQSHVNGLVKFTSITDPDYYAGGIAGRNSGIISECFMEGNVVSDSSGSIGAIAGYSDSSSKISCCYNLAVISGSPSENTESAGIVAFLAGTADSCFNYGKIERMMQSGYNGALYSYCLGEMSNCYYLDTSCSLGGFGPESTDGAMTAEEFNSGKAAYYLNSRGETQENSYIWSQKDGKPILADSENQPVVRAVITQDSSNPYKASVNGITNGKLYAKAGTPVRVKDEEKSMEGYIKNTEVSGLIPAEENYILPDRDVHVVITCTAKCIDYHVVLNPNNGNDIVTCTYNVETSLVFPTPKRSNADFLGWYDNEKFEGMPVTEIPKGSTGDKELWAKWYHYGYKAELPKGKGFEAVSLQGYDNMHIEEGGSYLFEIRKEEGYDISAIKVMLDGTELIPSNGIYRIDNIQSDIQNITVSGVKLERGHYKIEGIDESNGYVGKTAVIVPSLPATGIKKEGEKEFLGRITVDTGMPVTIVTSDDSGNISEPETITFKRDITAPQIKGAAVSFVDKDKKYKGVYITVEAEDLESGISEYSFDGGLTWQKENRLFTECMETETVFDKTICVKDKAGNVAEYKESVTIPAVTRIGSSINLSSANKSYAYGSDILLTADITFDEEMENVSGYGSVTVLSEEGELLGTAEVVKTASAAGRAVITISYDKYGAPGEKVCSAVYNGSGSPYRDCGPVTVNIDIVKAVVSAVDVKVPDSFVVSAARQYTLKQLVDMITVDTAEVTTDSGLTYRLPVTWVTADKYNASGRTYHFIGTLSGNEYVEVPEGCSLSTKVVVEPIKRPSSLSVSKRTKNSVQLKWGRVKGADGYEIYRKTAKGSYKKYKTIKGGKNVSFIDKGLKRSEKYYYKVRAFINGSAGKIYGSFSSSSDIYMGKMISSDELKLNTTKFKLKAKKSKTLKVTYPKGRSKSQIKSVKYQVSKAQVAKVNAKGKVTAKKKGTAYVYVMVKLKNGQSRKLKAKVTVI